MFAFPSVIIAIVGVSPLFLAVIEISTAFSRPEAIGVPPPPGRSASFFLACTKERVAGKRTSAFVPLKAISETWSLLA